MLIILSLREYVESINQFGKNCHCIRQDSYLSYLNVLQSCTFCFLFCFVLCFLTDFVYLSLESLPGTLYVLVLWQLLSLLGFHFLLEAVKEFHWSFDFLLVGKLLWPSQSAPWTQSHICEQCWLVSWLSNLCTVCFLLRPLRDTEGWWLTFLLLLITEKKFSTFNH